jgi:DNA-binding NarL/FixJ family response regulator
LEQQSELEIVGEVMDGRELLAEVEMARPDLVLLDWSLLQKPAVDLLVALREVCPHLAVIVLSGKPELRAAALTAGADAFVTKVDPPEQLLAAIWSVQRLGRLRQTGNVDCQSVRKTIEEVE